MSAPLSTWLVWHDRAPLRTPVVLEQLQAATIDDARTLAATRHPGKRLHITSWHSVKAPDATSRGERRQ